MKRKYSEPYTAALTRVVNALAEFVGDEDCDHAVGVCYCDSIRAMIDGARLVPIEGLSDTARMYRENDEDEERGALEEKEQNDA